MSRSNSWRRWSRGRKGVTSVTGTRPVSCSPNGHISIWRRNGLPHPIHRLDGSTDTSSRRQSHIPKVHFPRFASDYKALIKRIRPVASCQVEIISLKIGVAAHSQRRRNPMKCQTGTTFWNTASNCTLKNKVLHYVTRIKFTSQILNEFNSKNFHFKHLRVPHIGQARPCHRIKRRSPSKI